jgi:hypothetical protein
MKRWGNHAVALTSGASRTGVYLPDDRALLICALKMQHHLKGEVWQI